MKRKTREPTPEEVSLQQRRAAWYSFRAAKAVRLDSRICFSLAYFATEADAIEGGRLSAKAGNTYNGGYFHGMPCGRDRGHDHVDKDTGKMLYAVTE
jgi:hypothetical protein